MYGIKDMTVGYVTGDKRDASHSWFLCVFVFLLSPRQLITAALCWASTGLAVCCGFWWRAISDIELFCFGVCRAARAAARAAAAATVAATVAPAMLPLTWTGTPGPHLHDNGAVIFWTEVRAIWRTGVKFYRGQLDLRIDDKKRICERAAKCQKQQGKK